MSSKNILVIGSANTDMVVKSKKLPLPGETVLGGTFFMNAGGKGANQAVAAARLGGNVTLVAKVGNDIFGKQSIAGFKKENIDTDYVFMDDKEPSGTALIMVNQEGENCIVVAPGANANLLQADIEKVSMIATAGIILMQLEIPMETIVAAAKTAKSNSQKVILNPAPAQPLQDELLKDLFLITPNETEATLLTSVSVTDEATASEAAAVFISKGVQNVIITMGRKGAFFQNSNLKFTIPAPNVKPIDTTAAGDTFNGAIAVAIIEGMDWTSAVKFAVMAASISVTRMGAQTSVPFRNELIFDTIHP
jgi:ribokinase